MICSFQKPETWQVTLRPSPPPDVPRPDQCTFAWENARRQATSPDAPPRARVYLLEYAHVRFVCSIITGAAWAHFYMCRNDRRASCRSSLPASGSNRTATSYGSTGSEWKACQNAARRSRRYHSHLTCYSKRGILTLKQMTVYPGLHIGFTFVSGVIILK